MTDQHGNHQISWNCCVASFVYVYLLMTRYESTILSKSTNLMHETSILYKNLKFFTNQELLCVIITAAPDVLVNLP